MENSRRLQVYGTEVCQTGSGAALKSLVTTNLLQDTVLRIVTKYELMRKSWALRMQKLSAVVFSVRACRDMSVSLTVERNQTENMWISGTRAII